MAVNTFEESRVAAGTLNRNGQKPGIESDATTGESSAISRDDVRDGFESPRVNTRRILSAGTLGGDHVRNRAGKDLGAIEEIMLDIPSGRIAYAVLSFGGFLGIGSKLFAVPWSALQIDEAEHEFTLNVDPEMLESAPGFDKDNWPDMADSAFGESIHQHYRATPYWEHTATNAGYQAGGNK